MGTDRCGRGLENEEEVKGADVMQLDEMNSRGRTVLRIRCAICVLVHGTANHSQK